MSAKALKQLHKLKTETLDIFTLGDIEFYRKRYHLFFYTCKNKKTDESQRKEQL